MRVNTPNGFDLFKLKYVIYRDIAIALDVQSCTITFSSVAFVKLVGFQNTNVGGEWGGWNI